MFLHLDLDSLKNFRIIHRNIFNSSLRESRNIPDFRYICQLLYIMCTCPLPLCPWFMYGFWNLCSNFNLSFVMIISAVWFSKITQASPRMRHRPRLNCSTIFSVLILIQANDRSQDQSRDQHNRLNFNKKLSNHSKVSADLN